MMARSDIIFRFPKNFFASCVKKPSIWLSFFKLVHFFMPFSLIRRHSQYTEAYSLALTELIKACLSFICLAIEAQYIDARPHCKTYSSDRSWCLSSCPPSDVSLKKVFTSRPNDSGRGRCLVPSGGGDSKTSPRCSA